VRIAIDDFGTGYASLSYLMHLPVDVVKIDRSYVRDVGRRGDSGATVQAIIRFARALGMDVIAEGVESSAEAGNLRAWAVITRRGSTSAGPSTPRNSLHDSACRPGRGPAVRPQ